MTDKVFKTIKNHNMISSGDIVGVGLSGGADSVALTHFLAINREKLGLKELKAVHIHHGIRGKEADRDLEFSKQLCEKLNIEFLSFKADVPSLAKENGESVEECARRIRYDFFAKAECDKFATAHNLNDNMETFIFNLSRGTALSGLCGIPYVRDIYIRPLLDCTRQEIEGYISENGLSFITDSTNLCDDYTRNKIRHNILPMFFELNKSFDKAFIRCLDSVYASDEYIKQTAYELLAEAEHDGFFDCTVFKTQHTAVRYEVISAILKRGGVNNITKEHLKAVDNIIANGGSADLPGKIKVTSERNRLFFGDIKTTPDFLIKLGETEEIAAAPTGKYKISFYVKKDLQNLNKEVLDNLIDCDKISSNLVLRNRREGDSAKLRGRGVTKTLKKLFNESKIPVARRSEIAVLADENGILWIEGFGVCERCKPSEKTEKFMYIKKRGIEDAERY